MTAPRRRNAASSATSSARKSARGSFEFSQGRETENHAQLLAKTDSAHANYSASNAGSTGLSATSFRVLIRTAKTELAASSLPQPRALQALPKFSACFLGDA